MHDLDSFAMYRSSVVESYWLIGKQNDVKKCSLNVSVLKNTDPNIHIPSTLKELGVASKCSFKQVQLTVSF